MLWLGTACLWVAIKVGDRLHLTPDWADELQGRDRPAPGRPAVTAPRYASSVPGGSAAGVSGAGSPALPRPSC